jgi:hypothetical protein
MGITRDAEQDRGEALLLLNHIWVSSPLPLSVFISSFHFDLLHACGLVQH